MLLQPFESRAPNGIHATWKATIDPGYTYCRTVVSFHDFYPGSFTHCRGGDYKKLSGADKIMVGVSLLAVSSEIFSPGGHLEYLYYLTVPLDPVDIPGVTKLKKNIYLKVQRAECQVELPETITPSIKDSALVLPHIISSWDYSFPLFRLPRFPNDRGLRTSGSTGSDSVLWVRTVRFSTVIPSDIQDMHMQTSTGS